MNILRKKIHPLVLLLLLPLFATSVAAEDPHPLHGTWFSEQPDENLDMELELRADGTFRMVVVSKEGIITEEEDFDGDEHGDDLDAEESWEDVLADLDTDNNGVIDEEEYQAVQEVDDEDVLEFSLADLNDDGVIDEEEFNYWSEADSDDELGAVMAEIFGEEIVMTMVATGTWDTQDDQFTLDFGSVDVKINDMTLGEFYGEIFNWMIDAMFEESALSEEEFMAMISEDDPTITAKTLEELKAAMVDEILTDMDESDLFDFADDNDTEIFAYNLEGQELTATDSFGDTVSYVRLGQSAVEAVSWGQIKAMSR